MHVAFPKIFNFFVEEYFMCNAEKKEEDVVDEAQVEKVFNMIDKYSPQQLEWLAEVAKGMAEVFTTMASYKQGHQ